MIKRMAVGALLASALLQKITAEAACTCSYTPALDTIFANYDVEIPYGGEILGENDITSSASTAGCSNDDTRWDLYSMTTYPERNNQVVQFKSTKDALVYKRWGFKLKFDGSNSGFISPGHTQDPKRIGENKCSSSEFIVLTHRSSDGKINASISAQFYMQGGVYDECFKKEEKKDKKDKNEKKLWGVTEHQIMKYCRKIVQDGPLPAYTQPTGSKYTFEGKSGQSEGKWQLNSLLERTFDCPEQNQLCYEERWANRQIEYSILFEAVNEKLSKKRDMGKTFSFDIENKDGQITDFQLYASPTTPLPDNFQGTLNTNGCYDVNFIVEAKDKKCWWPAECSTTSTFVLEYCNKCDDEAASMTMKSKDPSFNDSQANTEFLCDDFSHTISWQQWKWVERPFCPIYYNKLTFTFDDGGVKAYSIKVSDGKLKTSYANVVGSKGYSIDNRFSENFAHSTKSIETNQGRWSETPKLKFFGSHTVQIQPYYYKHDGGTYMTIDGAQLTYTLTFVDRCRETWAIEVYDEAKLAKIHGAPSDTYLGENLIIDSSLFTTTPFFTTEIDVKQINRNCESACGAITLTLEVNEITPVVQQLSHAYFASPSLTSMTPAASATTAISTINYLSGWPEWQSGLVTRTVSYELTVTHQDYPKSNGGAFVTFKTILTEHYCAIRFYGVANSLQPNAPVLLNNHVTPKRFVIPINQSLTPHDCRQQDMYDIQFQSSDGTWTSLTDLASTPPVLFTRPAGTFNEFDLTVAASQKSFARIWPGRVIRKQYGNSVKDHDFELVLCWLSHPATVIKEASYITATGTKEAKSEPLSIDRSGTKASLDIILEPYTFNDPKCGNIVYEFTTSPNAKSMFQATDVANTISFLNHDHITYAPGKMTVTVDVKSDQWPSEIIDTVTFDIDIVDCLNEPYDSDKFVEKQDLTALSSSPLSLRFTNDPAPNTFDETVTIKQSVVFKNIVAQNTCKIWQHRITCEDNQLDLKTSYASSDHVTPPTVKSSVYQGTSEISTNSEPCSKFKYDPQKPSVAFSMIAYNGIVDKKDYEGKYKITSVPLHESNQPFTIAEQSFEVEIKLNCDEVVITQQIKTLTFSIQTPATDIYLPASKALFYWMRDTQTYELPIISTNPHPFSCTLEEKLAEIQQDADGEPVLDLQDVQILETARSNVDLFISMQTTTGQKPQITVESTYNEYFTPTKGAPNGNEILMMYEAKLTGSTSRLPTIFKYFIFQDCTPRATEWDLAEPLQTTPLDAFQIDGSSTLEFISQLQVPTFTSTFSKNNGCPMMPELQSTAQTKADLDAKLSSSTFWIVDKIAQATPLLELHYKATKNTEVQTYQHDDDSVDCDLTVAGQKTCAISYQLNANSVNGTVAIQTIGTLTISSECLYIKTRHAAQLNFWHLSTSSTNAQTIVDGYEVRDPKVTFELPFVQLSLASEPDPLQIFQRCGPLTYTVKIDSTRPGPYEPDIIITYLSTSVFESGHVEVETDDQSFTNTDEGSTYDMEFTFEISAKFDLYEDEITFTYDPTVKFKIHDYCTGMFLSAPPDLNALTDTQEQIIKGVKNDKGVVQQWVNKISKHLLTDETIIDMSYMSYKKWPGVASSPTHGCGNLRYELIYKSWALAWKGNDLMSRPNGSSYYGPQGTLHIIEATKRFQIGDHIAHIQVTSDLVPISTKQIIIFQIEILDCLVVTFGPGLQYFKDLQVLKNSQAYLPFTDYIQEPSCEFPIVYTITLVEKPFGSIVPQAFMLSKEGQQPDPPFVYLANDQVTIAPMDQHAGFGYSVYINGHLQVNSTMQGPMTALNDEFTVHVPPNFMILQNQPPFVSNQITEVIVTAGQNTTIDLGMPYDMNLDKFFVSEWGLLDGQEIPIWITFKNETIEDGIKFSFEPSEENIGKEYKLFYELDDGKDSKKYTFTIETAEAFEGFQNDNTTEKVQESRTPEIVSVFVDEAKDDGSFDVRFSKYIKLPSNLTEWTDENEGHSRIHLEFVASEATETLIYDQDLSLLMSWRITGFNEKDDENEGRRLNDPIENNKNQTLIEVNKLTFTLNFTIPEAVSRDAFDTLRVEVQQKMFAEENVAFALEDVVFVEANKAGYITKIKVPQQIDTEMIEQALMISESTSNALRTFLSTNFFLSIFSAGALQYLWGLINSLQIIVLSVLFNIDIAPNADMIMVAILQTVSLEFISTEDFIDEMFGGFRETKPFMIRVDENGYEHSKFVDAGYDTSNFVMLLGPIFIIVVAYLSWITIRLLLRLAFSRCDENFITQRLRRSLDLRVVVMRFILEGCVEIGLSAIIAVKMIEKEIFDDGSEIFSLTLAFLFLLLLIAAPFGYIKLVYDYLKDQKKPEDERQFDQQEMFVSLRKNKYALCYPIVFTLRRYIIVIILTIMPDYTYSQIIVHQYSTIYYVAYLWYNRPYELSSLNKQEIVNECLVLLSTYPLLVLTKWEQTVERRQEAGWAIVACIVAIVIFNIIFLIVSVLMSCTKRLHLRYIKYQRKQAFLKKQDELSLLNFDRNKKMLHLASLYQLDAMYNRPPLPTGELPFEKSQLDIGAHLHMLDKQIVQGNDIHSCHQLWEESKLAKQVDKSDQLLNISENSVIMVNVAEMIIRNPKSNPIKLQPQSMKPSQLLPPQIAAKDKLSITLEPTVQHVKQDKAVKKFIKRKKQKKGKRQNSDESNDVTDDQQEPSEMMKRIMAFDKNIEEAKEMLRQVDFGQQSTLQKDKNQQ